MARANVVRIERNPWIEDTVLLQNVQVGPGTRLRRTIVQNGVHLPAGYSVGFDVQEDRKSHTVTEKGVVVVSRSPEVEKPVPRAYIPSTTPNDLVSML